MKPLAQMNPIPFISNSNVNMADNRCNQHRDHRQQHAAARDFSLSHLSARDAAAKRPGNATGW
jgi:hypothetical protein